MKQNFKMEMKREMKSFFQIGTIYIRKSRLLMIETL